MLVYRSTSRGELDVNKPPQTPAQRTGRRARRKKSSLVRRFWWKQVMCDAPGWWLAGLLVIAPWAYGTTFPQTKELLAGALLVLIGLFVISRLIQRRWPKVHWLPAALTLIILTQGWVMVLNPKLVYDSTVQYFHFVPTLIPWLPGTVDRGTSLDQMWLITGLFGAFWAVNDLGADPEWRDRFWVIMSITGVSLVGLGLLQRVTGAPGIFWRSDLDSGPTFFATYRYHANAGAFINISLLLTAARMICMFRRDHSNLVRSFWVLAFLGTLVSAFVNVSRAATLIGLVALCCFLCWKWHERARTNKVAFGWTRLTGFAIAGFLAAALLVWSVGFKDAYRHWAELGKSLVSDGDGRFMLYGAIVRYIIPASGWWGFGPGTFHLIFPFFTNNLGTRLQGYWEYAHEDYLQTLVEWGFCGATAWFIFFGQTVARATWTLGRRYRRWSGNTRRFAIASLLALGTILVHATVDFPMQIASLQLYTAVLLGLVAASRQGGERRLRRVRKLAEATGGQQSDQEATLSQQMSGR